MSARLSSGLLASSGLAAFAALGLMWFWRSSWWKARKVKGAKESTAPAPAPEPALAKPTTEPGVPPGSRPGLPTARRVPTKPKPKPAADAPLEQSQPVFVGFGSQTGNAKAIAQDLFQRCQKNGIDVRLNQLNDWRQKLELPFDQVQVAVVVVSTTGNGDAPEGADRFVRYLKKQKKESTSLDGMRFAVLALGDTNYDQFCETGKFIERRLKALGAKAFHQLGCADDGTGLEEVVVPWCNGLIPALRALLTKANERKDQPQGCPAGTPAPDNRATAATALSATCVEAAASIVGPLGRSRGVQPLASFVAPDSLFAAVTCKKTESFPAVCGCDLYATCALGRKEAQAVRDAEGDAEGDDKLTFSASLAAARYLTAGGPAADRRVVHVQVQPESTATAFRYNVGDAIGLTCENRAEDVAAVLRCLRRGVQVDPECPISITYAQSGQPAAACALAPAVHCADPCPSTRTILQHAVDLAAPVKPALLRALASHARAPAEAAVLSALAHRDGPGAAAFQAFVASQALTVAELVECFPSVAPPLAFFVGALPPLAPRFYSVASAPQVLPDAVAIAFSVDEWQAGPVPRRGLCTGFLEAQLQAQLVGNATASAPRPLRMTLKPATTFTLPANPTTPVIMVGPGTGVAPFIGFIQARAAQAQPTGPLALYFGCRNAEQDWLYREEMENALQAGVLTHLQTAFSRDGPGKVYVQHRLREDTHLVRDWLLHRGGYLFVCGDGSRMAKSVHAAVRDIIAGSPECASVEHAEAFLQQMKNTGRYVQDIWSA